MYYQFSKRRTTNLFPLLLQGVARYADTEHARYWMPDHVSRECYECGTRFSAFRRRHHCRICGQIFCARCCSHRVPGHVCGCAGGLRVCTHCARVVLEFLHTGGEGMAHDLHTLQNNLKVSFIYISGSIKICFLFFIQVALLVGPLNLYGIEET